MGDQVRWSFEVSRNLDLDVREYLLERGKSQADLAGLIEHALVQMLWNEATDDGNESAKELTDDEVETLVAEALREVRSGTTLDRNTWTRVPCAPSSTPTS